MMNTASNINEKTSCLARWIALARLCWISFGLAASADTGISYFARYQHFDIKFLDEVF